ncbi:MAG: DUF378 domain-containing protein [Patescibacteria group bacterium]|nr:DUF378 domain-containing protein [Patescibacteria group bacterium]MDE1967164.1 DUF378 domain-containing protein [Patescibacteria group bacterium]
MKAIHVIAFVLLVIGGLNWLLVGLGFNLVDAIFGAGSVLSTIIYILVGISALWLVFTHKSACKTCSTSASAPAQM